MPRILDKATGQIIELPYGTNTGSRGVGSARTAGPSARAYGTAYTQGSQQSPLDGYIGQGGIPDVSSLRNMLLMASLSDPKNASKYNTILNIAQPTSQEIKKENERAKKQRDISDIEKAIDYLEKGTVKTGPIAGRALKLRAQVLDTASPEEVEFYNIISRIGTERMFELGGKRLPAAELERLRPFIPEIQSPETTVLENLEKLKREYQTVSYFDEAGAGFNYPGTQNTQTNYRGSTEPSRKSLDEIFNY